MEPRAPLTFAGARLDRASGRRAEPEWLEARLEDPDARALVVSDAAVLMGDEGPALVQPRSVRGETVLLGLLEGRPLFAVDGTGAENGRMSGLREVASSLSQTDAGLVAYAIALLNWHRRHRFCSNCGAPTVSSDAGHQRRCPSCGALHFPRTDPVVIMRVIADDRLLLGRQASWPEERYSILAGYVEPGETLEQAVRREVLEESGVRVESVEYVASQPWPFPTSLMLGFEGRAAGGDPRPGDGELADVRWFTRSEVEDAAAGRSGIRLPPGFSISRRLIDGWLGVVSDPADRDTRRRSW
ncbi:MAG TPA: NAD(+) diphosphatase [Thermoleophilaceae bacterium]|jgi:NAD+ diphosphatase